MEVTFPVSRLFCAKLLSAVNKRTIITGNGINRIAIVLNYGNNIPMLYYEEIKEMV